MKKKTNKQKQTNKQSNKQTNKQTKNKQPNKQTNKQKTNVHLSHATVIKVKGSKGSGLKIRCL